MSEELKLNMDAYLPLRDVVFHTLRDAILKGDLRRKTDGDASRRETRRQPYTDS